MESEIERTPLWADVRKILQGDSKPVRFAYTGVIHTEKEDIEILKITSIDIVRDYVLSIGDQVMIEIQMGMGDYIRRLYPARTNLELTLSKQQLMETGASLARNKSASNQRYKAVFLPRDNPQYNMTHFESYDTSSLNNMDIVPIKLQLLDRSLEPIRIKTIQGSYNGYTPKELVRSLLAGESLQILVDGKPAIDGIDIAEPDRQEKVQHVILPSGTPIVNVPSMIQERFGGIYTGGVGNYLQRYRDKSLWFVYPLYNALRYDTAAAKCIFYAIPGHRFSEIEKTYREEPDVSHVLVTGQKIITDSADVDYMDKGNGFRLTDARSMMKKPVKITDKGPIGARNQLNHESVVQDRSDGLNYAPVADRNISSNPFAQYSQVMQRAGTRIDLIWENANPALIYPGMPCKYAYWANDKLQEVKGVVLFNHAYTQISGKGKDASAYLTSCALTLYVLPNAS